MPVTYANGTANADGYLSGISIPTASALLSNIRDVLVNAGQNVNDTDIAAGKIVSEGDDNGDKCIFRWEIETVSANQKNLIVRGDYDGTETSLSPALEMPYWEGDQSRLYLSVDQAGGCIFPLNGSNLSRSVHFGFPERLTDDKDMWMLGYLDQWLTNVYIAEDIYDVRWREMKTYFYSGTEDKISKPVGGYQLLWDSLTQAFMPITNFNTYSSGNKNNPAYKPWLGAVDPITGLPILSHYGYLIGKNGYNQYEVLNNDTTEETAIALHFPGQIRFARTGLASTDTGNQYFSAQENVQVISGGAAKNYQGFIIQAS